MSIIYWPNERAKFAIRFTICHLLVSVAVAFLASLLVFFVWYPAPTARLLGVGNIYMIVLAVDVVCGPLLTLVLASPRKPRRELVQDLCLVIIIQIGALSYGLHALESARPVAYVFEQDRLVVVAKNTLYEADCNEQCMPTSKWWGIDWHAASAALQGDAGLQSLDLSLQGISPSMRRSAWRAWIWSDPKLQSALHPLPALSEEKKSKLAYLRGVDYINQPGLMFLPLVSEKTLDWIAIFDRQGDWVDSLPIDGFD